MNADSQRMCDLLHTTQFEIHRFNYHFLKGYFSLNDFYAWAACNGQNSKE